MAQIYEDSLEKVGEEYSMVVYSYKDDNTESSYWLHVYGADLRGLAGEGGGGVRASLFSNGGQAQRGIYHLSKKERKKEFYLSSSRDIHLKNSYMSEQSYIEHCRVDVYCDLSIEWYYTTYTKEGR